ncbi:hypothetical protein Tco_1384004 [Tanacetum coccineum]
MTIALDAGESEPSLNVSTVAEYECVSSKVGYTKTFEEAAGVGIVYVHVLKKLGPGPTSSGLRNNEKLCWKITTGRGSCTGERTQKVSVIPILNHNHFTHQQYGSSKKVEEMKNLD